MNMTDIEYKPEKREIPRSMETFQDIPDGYFENLPDKLICRISAVESTNRKLQRIKYLFGIAAALLVLVGLGVILMMDRKDRVEITISETLADDSTHIPQSTMMFIDNGAHDKPDAGNASNIQVTKSVEQQNDNIDMMALLDNIPIEVIIDYLVEIEELEF